jgi:hypothetical protein
MVSQLARLSAPVENGEDESHGRSILAQSRITRCFNADEVFAEYGAVRFQFIAGQGWAVFQIHVCHTVRNSPSKAAAPTRIRTASRVLFEASLPPQFSRRCLENRPQRRL